MKKNNLIIIIISVIVVIGLGVGGFFVWQSINSGDDIIQPDSGEIVEEKKGLAELATIKTVKIQEGASGANRIIDIKYPSILSFKDKSFQNHVNKAITDVILAYKDEIMVMVDDETPETALYTYKTSFEKYANGDYLSIVIDNDYQTGGIRSIKWKDIYNINMRSERIFYLADIFPANLDYEREILKEISTQAKGKNYVLMNGAGLNELTEKQKFYIDEGKLIIYFDSAEIAQAGYGVLQFEMPFELDENGLFQIK